MNHNDNAEQNNNRRRALKLLLGGSVVGTAAALPTRWTRPVVEAVVLPAHAQLSGPLYFLSTGNSANLVTAAVDPGRLLNLVVPSAVAGGTPPAPSTPYSICISVNNGIATVRVNLPPSTYTACSLQGSGPVGGTDINLTDLCGAPGCVYDAYCTVNLNPEKTQAFGVIDFVTAPSENEYSDEYTADLVESCSLPTFPCPM